LDKHLFHALEKSTLLVPCSSTQFHVSEHILGGVFPIPFESLHCQVIYLMANLRLAMLKKQLQRRFAVINFFNNMRDAPHIGIQRSSNWLDHRRTYPPAMMAPIDLRMKCKRLHSTWQKFLWVVYSHPTLLFSDPRRHYCASEIQLLEQDELLVNSSNRQLILWRNSDAVPTTLVKTFIPPTSA